MNQHSLTMMALDAMGEDGDALKESIFKTVMYLRGGSASMKGSLRDGFLNRYLYLDEPGQVYVIRDARKNLFRVSDSPEVGTDVVYSYETDARIWSLNRLNTILESSIDRAPGTWFQWFRGNVPQWLETASVGLVKVCGGGFLEMAEHYDDPPVLLSTLSGSKYFWLMDEVDKIIQSLPQN
jgi:hypothetical protein